MCACVCVCMYVIFHKPTPMLLKIKASSWDNVFVHGKWWKGQFFIWEAKGYNYEPYTYTVRSFCLKETQRVVHAFPVWYPRLQVGSEMACSYGFLLVLAITTQCPVTVLFCVLFIDGLLTEILVKTSTHIFTTLWFSSGANPYRTGK